MISRPTAYLPAFICFGAVIAFLDVRVLPWQLGMILVTSKVSFFSWWGCHVQGNVTRVRSELQQALDTVAQLSKEA